MPENNGHNKMIADEFNEDVCERYILGELSDGDQEQFEAAYFSDDAFFEKYLAFKTELLDLYSRGQLPEEKRQKFEKHFLATAPRRQRAADAKEFISAVTAFGARLEPAAPVVKPTRLSIFQYLKGPALAWAVVLIAVLAGVWWLVSRKPQEPEVAHVQTQPSSPISQPTAIPERSPDGSMPPDQPVTVPSTEPVHNIPEAGRQPDVSRNIPPITTQTPARPAISVPAAAIALNLVATRGEGGGNTLTLYSDTPKAIIELPKAPIGRRQYSAVIQTLSGEVRWRSDRVKPAAGSGRLKLSLDAGSLKSGDYTVTVRTTPAANAEVIAEYYLRVERSTQKTPSSPK
jgi:hypothetical protein